MASVTINIYPGPNGPIYQATGTAGTTVTINDFTATQSIDKETTPVADSLGRPGTQRVLST